MVDGDVLGRHGPVARARPPPRGRGRELLRCARLDQRLHRRLPDPESRACPRRRCGRVLRLRPRLQRAAREGREGASLARRLDRLLAVPARGRWAHGGVHARSAVPDAAPHGRLRRPHRDALADPLPHRRPDGPVRDLHGHPEQLRPVHGAGDHARLLEPRDHRRPRAGCSTRRHGGRQALRLRRLDRDRDGDPAPPAAALDTRPGRPAPARRRPARPRREAGLQAAGARRPRARPDQRQRGHRHDPRVEAHRPDDRAERDRQGVPDLHAAPGHVLGRGRDGALPVARPVGDPR